MAMIRGRPGRASIRFVTNILRDAPRFVQGRVSSRRSNVWAFGNVHGFRDSARYLAEYLVSDRPDIAAYWIANDATSADAARAAGLRVSEAASADAARVLRAAGAVFFTHGFKDLDMPLASGSYQVFLWHGTPLKRIGLDAGPPESRKLSFLSRMAMRTVTLAHRHAFSWVDLYVAGGELDEKRFLSAFGTVKQKIAVLGSPRFDVIHGGPAYERVAHGDLRARLGYGPADTVLLWMPTHRREYGDAGWLPHIDAAALEDALAGTNVKLLIKTHPNADWDVYRERIADSGRVQLLREADVDPNALLHIADGLLTDYSSAVFDYSILRRPIYFFAPDVERYEASRGLYEPYADITQGSHH